MIVLQIEHKVASFDGWKKAFDSDPVGRKKAGVKKYRVYRPADDTNYVIVDLLFDDIEKAELMLSSLKNLWKKVEGTVMMNPSTRILNLTESVEL
jgi:hypothetical protein